MGNNYPQPPSNGKVWRIVIGVIIVILAIVLILRATNVSAQEVGGPVIPVLSPEDDPLTLLIKILIILSQLILIPFLLQWWAERKTRNIANKAEAEAARQAIEEKHARILHSALNTASDLILDPNLSFAEKQAKGIEYVKKSATDAVNSFAMSDTMILDMLTAYWNRKSGAILGGSDEVLPLATPGSRAGFSSSS